MSQPWITMLLAAVLAAGCTLAIAAPVANLRAEARPGQILLRWDEDAANDRDLSVYMSEQPINQDNLAEATLLCDKVEPHSATDLYEHPEGSRGGKVECGWVLEDGGEPADMKDGVYAHTVREDDPPKACFAVTCDGQLQPGLNSLAEPIDLVAAETVAIWQGGDAAHRESSPGKMLCLRLHAKTGRPGEHNFLAFGTPDLGWRDGLPFKFRVRVTEDALWVEPHDRTWINRRLTESGDGRQYEYMMPESMWYGYNDKIYDPELKPTGTPTNYSERRVLWIMDWVQRTYKTDPNRVYAFGSSMGTGAAHLALHHPDRFASVDLHVPFLDGSYSRGKESNASRYIAMCGSMDLICSDGIRLGDRLNLVKVASETPGDLPFIVMRAGRNDASVFWYQKPHFIRAMQQQRHGLIACWDDGAHGTAMRDELPGLPKHGDYKWYAARFALNRSYPAFSNFSMNQDPGNGEKDHGDIVGCYNRGLDWKDIVDEAARYEMTVFAARPDAVYPSTVDITPRRVQKFRPEVGDEVLALNLDSAGDTVQRATCTVDEAGRITFRGFRLTDPDGNRMALTMAR